MDGIRFGAFELYPSERKLCDGGQPVELGARAFDLLLVLVENAGRLVPKATLLDRVWPKLVVDENNLPAQIASLRRILGAGAIRTVPGFGYRLELPVIRPATAAPAPQPAVSEAAPEPPPLSIPRRAWPNRLTPLVGRDADLAGVEAGLGRACLVTIVGTAGVGKTRLAEEILARETVQPATAAAFVALAPLAAVQQVPPAIALALGVSLPEGSDGFVALDHVVERAPLLLVLDGAEHLAAALAAPLAGLLYRNRALRVIVTSQCPLGITGETVYRLAALPVPGPDVPALEAASYAAVSLFTQRAAAADRSFEPATGNIGLIADICRRLDGNPLALELAAARVAAFGLAALRERLDDRFRLLKLGANAADARHGALHAAFDWSYGLLSSAEQKVFNRLGAFAGSFTLDAAARCVADPAIDAAEAIDLIARLVDRSLVAALPQDPPRYSLLETARLFAVERLVAAGEVDAARASMAATTLQQLDVAYQEYWSLDEAIWLQRYAPELENVRAAIGWAAKHDRALGVALYGSAWPLFVEAELATEARANFEQTVRQLVDTLPRARVGRFWEAVATYDSTRQCDRARYAAELAAAMHAEVGDSRASYYALMLLALNWGADNTAARQAFVAAHALEDPAWPARLLMHGALTEAALLTATGDFAAARASCQRAVRLALTVSERQALAATVRVVELDLACGETAGALALGRPLSVSLRHSGRHATRFELLTLLFGALLLAGETDAARGTGAELRALAGRLDPGKLYATLDAMALLACEDRRYEAAARVAGYADAAQAAHGLVRRGPTEERIRAAVVARLERELGPAWRALSTGAGRPLDDLAACSLALGLQV